MNNGRLEHRAEVLLLQGQDALIAWVMRLRPDEQQIVTAWVDRRKVELDQAPVRIPSVFDQISKDLDN